MMNPRLVGELRVAAVGAALLSMIGCPPLEGESASGATEATSSSESTTTGDETTAATTFGTTATTTSVSTTYATTAATTADTTATSTNTTDVDTDTAGPVSCVAAPLEHVEACPGDPCPIVADVELRCDDDEFAAPGVRVAPIDDATYVVTASSNARIFFRVDEGGGEEVDLLPEEYIRETILLAAGPDGALHTMADSTRPPDYDGGILHASDVDGWEASMVFDADKYIPPLDLEVGLDGTPHLWFIGDAPDQLNLATRVGDGPWAVVDAPTASGVDWTHFTLSSEGAPVSAGFREVAQGWQLWTLVDGVSSTLGGEVIDLFPRGYRLTPAPVPAAPPGPAYAAAIQHLDAVRVAWPQGESYAEVAVDGTEALTTLCESGWDQGCPGPCHELGGGLEDGLFAAARSSDGTVWLVYVRTDLDLTLMYSEACPMDAECYCKVSVGEDKTRSVLHVAKVPVDDPPSLVLSQPIAAPALYDLFIGWEDTPRALDARTYGDHLAIALRTADSDEGPYAVRVLRIDTTLLP